MISRLVTVAALVAGTALLYAPAQAQTGTTGQDTIQRGGASPSGSPGTTTNVPRGTMGTQDTTGAQGTMKKQGAMGGQQGGMQGGMHDRQQAAGSGMRGDAAERQMTECLNNAAAQQRPLSTCQR
jgi:hypothetical protein